MIKWILLVVVTVVAIVFFLQLPPRPPGEDKKLPWQKDWWKWIG